MDDTYKNQKGFTVVAAFFIVVVIALIGLVGWMAYKKDRQKDSSMPQSGAAQTDASACSGSKGTATAGMLSLDKSKLPCGWKVTSTTYTSDLADYKKLGFRYSLQLNNSASLKIYDRNNPALCYVSIYQIYKGSDDNRTPDQLIQADLQQARTSASGGGVAVDASPNSVISVHTAQGPKRLPAATYTTAYQDDGTHHQYSRGAFLVGADYIGKVAITCHSQKATNIAIKVVGDTLTFK